MKQSGQAYIHLSEEDFTREILASMSERTVTFTKINNLILETDYYE